MSTIVQSQDKVISLEETFAQDFATFLSQNSASRDVVKVSDSILKMLEDKCNSEFAEGKLSEASLAQFRNALNASQISFKFQFLSTKDNKQNFTELEVPLINLRDEISYLAVKYNKPREYFFNMDKTQLMILIEDSYKDYSPELRKLMIENSYFIYEMTLMKSEQEIIDSLKKNYKDAPMMKKVNLLVGLLSYIPKDSIDDLDSKQLGTIDVLKQIKDSVEKKDKLSYSAVNEMSQMAIRLAKELGFSETFGLESNSLALGKKETILLSNPKNPSEFFQLNFELPQHFKNTLIQDFDDIVSGGLKLVVQDGSERKVSFIKDPIPSLSSSSSSIEIPSKPITRQVGIQLPTGSVRLFFKENPSGNSLKTSGGNLNLKLGYEDVVYTEVGMSGFSSLRPESGSTAVDQSVSGRVATGLNIKIFESDNLSLSSFGDANFVTSINCSNADISICENEASKRIATNSGVRLTLQGDTVVNRTIFSSGVSVDAEEFVNSDGLSIINPVYKVSTDTDIKVTSEFTATIGIGVSRQTIEEEAAWQYSGKLGLGLRERGTYFEIRADGNLMQDTPIWYPGVDSQGSVILKQSLFKDKFFLGATGRSALYDESKEQYIGIFFGGVTE